jgi:hypothetical protein
MKLINAKTLEVVDIFGDVPPYAILSHTWDPGQEVSYQEMIAKEGRQKSGFLKIQRCCAQALADGLEWAWIDTCAIDKTSSADLSEAINSMFTYYSLAVVCYAYLSDVKESPAWASRMAIAQSFKSSRWFTRGWTLQELLAPTNIVFYSSEWTRIGTRFEWRDEIVEITGIQHSALDLGANFLSNFSIAQRMSWSANRTTTREEDIAYCLLGLFDVQMPLLYGEGSKAFIRLQEEIMRNSDDQSIFAWSNPAPANGRRISPMSLLAKSPSLFQNSNVVPVRQKKRSEPYVMTNAGLQLTGILWYNPLRWGKDVHILCLPVLDERQPDRAIGVPLIQISGSGDQCARQSTELINFPIFVLQQAPNLRRAQIYVRKEIIMPELHEVNHASDILLRTDIRTNGLIDLQCIDTYPGASASEAGTLIFGPPERKRMAAHLDGFSWHVVVIFSVQIEWGNLAIVEQAPISTPAVSVNEDCQCAMAIGYDGRRNKYWCALDDIKEIKDSDVAHGAWKELGNAVRSNVASHTYIRPFVNHDADGLHHAIPLKVGIQAALGHDEPAISFARQKEIVHVVITTGML